MPLPRPQLLEFGPDGKYLREIGHNLYAWSFAHMVKVDPHDNIWVTDKGSDMVIKFTPEGRVAMVFGRKQEASDEETGPLKHPKPPFPAEPGRFRQVTDVAFDGADNTFISDGYINSRVAKVDKDGNWLKSWGERGNGPGQFNTPHSIAVDAKGNVYVSDRGNHRIQVFDGEGNFLRQIVIDVPVPPSAKPAIGNIPGAAQLAAGTFTPGSPWTTCITPGPNQVLYSADAWPGRIYKADARWPSAGCARRERQAVEAVRLDPRACLPLRERALGRRAAELARAKAGAAPVVKSHEIFQISRPKSASSVRLIYIC